jgi:hypothetical protein
MTAKKKVVKKVSAKKVAETPARKRRVVRMARPYRTDVPTPRHRARRIQNA